jgi:hypothetical protein
MTAPLTEPRPGEVARRALPILKSLRERDREYQEACEADWRRGFRPHYCPHGMNLWVDWDPICGPCEESLTLLEEAVAIARGQIWQEREQAKAEAAARRHPWGEPL